MELVLPRTAVPPGIPSNPGTLRWSLKRAVIPWSCRGVMPLRPRPRAVRITTDRWQAPPGCQPHAPRRRTPDICKYLDSPNGTTLAERSVSVGTGCDRARDRRHRDGLKRVCLARTHAIERSDWTGPTSPVEKSTQFVCRQRINGKNCAWYRHFTLNMSSIKGG